MRGFPRRPGRAIAAPLAAALLLAACTAVDRPRQDAGTVGVSAPTRPSSVGVDADARHCVAMAMYWEARGEGSDGMLAVGSVIRNRVADSRFPDTHCGVVYQGGETPPCQFSWWCDGKSDRPTDAALWRLSLELAERLLADPPPDITRGALFFHSAAMSSPWRRKPTARIGNHVFYR